MHPQSTVTPFVTLKCAGCGASFARPRRLVEQRPGQVAFFCTHGCRRHRVARTCEACGASFEAVPSEISSRGARWCSRTCADIGRKRGEQRTCKTCGAIFYVFPSRRRRGPADYCSSACYAGEARSKLLRGQPKTAAHRAALSKPKRRKPGQPPPKPWLYYGLNWVAQARQARKRDGYCCQRCGKHQLRPALDVHHIRPFRDFAGDWMAANQIDNLLTLCHSCHGIVEPRGPGRT